MWTEREKYITSIDELKAYLEFMDEFHDYRIGHIDYAVQEATITVEEIVSASHIANTTGLVWDFKFDEIKTFKISSDCVVGFFINEITVENNDIIFNCTNGYIIVNAEQVKLGIPKN